MTTAMMVLVLVSEFGTKFFSDDSNSDGDGDGDGLVLVREFGTKFFSQQRT